MIDEIRQQKKEKKRQKGFLIGLSHSYVEMYMFKGKTAIFFFKKFYMSRFLLEKFYLYPDS